LVETLIDGDGVHESLEGHVPVEIARDVVGRHDAGN
jgi:hypothetical protein